MRIPLSAPDVDDADRAAVMAVLRSRSLSLGPELSAFERDAAAYLGTTRAVATSSGTAGLHLSLLALGVGPGDEVITTPFSFIASANAILYVGAKPVFVDVRPDALDLEPKRVEAAITPKTRAILLVHVFGRPALAPPLLEIARRRGLALIEDACEAIGAEIGGRKVGSFGDVGVFGFYPNKAMTTGEGGLVATSNDAVAKRIASLRNQGRVEGGDWFDHAELGFNYRLSDIACALGRSQLSRLPSILERRAEVAAAYDARLRGRIDLRLPDLSPKEGRVSWFVYVVRLPSGATRADRDRVFDGLRAAGIGCGRYFAPIHLQPFYRSTFGYDRGAFPIAEEAGDLGLALPFFNRLTERDQDDVVATLRRLL
jgi:perosamine synthetase